MRNDRGSPSLYRVDDGLESGSPPAVAPHATPPVTAGPQPPTRPGGPHWVLSRMRQIGMILAFDLLGPLLTFSLLRSGAYLIEVAGRLVVVETTSTEIALLVSKLVP
jgi:hypothetical protein